MPDLDEAWRPGSFTKNFGWGPETGGLSRLHRAIRICFGDGPKKVPRSVCQQKLKAEKINHYIVLNFFLYNSIQDGEDFILPDELIFQALNFDHGKDFDKIALFAFNLSIVGRWKGAHEYQSRPALWSNRYVVERLGGLHHWDVSKISSDDIDRFLISDNRYTGQTTRKLSTNLNYLYEVGGLSEMVGSSIDRWWMNAAFLAADRFCMSGISRRLSVESLLEAFTEFEFFTLTGGESRERAYALTRALEMYVSIGGPERFEIADQAIASGEVNDDRPIGLVDKMLPRAVKTIPAGVLNPLIWENKSYESLDFDELSAFKVDDYVRKFTLEGIKRISERGHAPKTSARELMDIMRG